MRLSERVAIVTGGGKGIGSAYCRGLADEGAKVVVADIDVGGAEQVAEQIRSAGGKAAVSRFGGIDILLNNASLMSALPRRAWHDIPFEEWDRVMGVNLRGTFLCCLAVFPVMRQRGYGKIINISSGRSLTASSIGSTAPLLKLESSGSPARWRESLVTTISA